MDKIMPDRLKKSIQHVIEGTEYCSDRENMLIISQYYRYMSECIISEKIDNKCDRELLNDFESIYLWVQEKAVYLPHNLQQQIETIFVDEGLCELFAILASFSGPEISRINKQQLYLNLFKLIFVRGRKSIESGIVSHSRLINAKVSLTRLAQLTKYAAHKLTNDFYTDDGLKDFYSRYNPNIINKHKITVLLNLLKVKLTDINQKDEDIVLLLNTVEKIEKEINKPRPHWGVIFSTIAIIFGFTADLKTHNPDIYTAPLQIIESIIYNLHEDGQIRKNIIDPHEKQHPEHNHTKQIALFRKEEIDLSQDNEKQ